MHNANKLCCKLWYSKCWTLSSAPSEVFWLVFYQFFLRFLRNWVEWEKNIINDNTVLWLYFAEQLQSLRPQSPFGKELVFFSMLVSTQTLLEYKRHNVLRNDDNFKIQISLSFAKQSLSLVKTDRPRSVDCLQSCGGDLHWQVIL